MKPNFKQNSGNDFCDYLIASRIPPGQVLRSRVLLFGVVAGLVYLVVLVFLVRVLCCRRRGRLSRVSRLAR